MASFLGKTGSPVFSCAGAPPTGGYTVGFLGDKRMEYSVVFNTIDSCILWAAYQEFVAGNSDIASGSTLVSMEDGGPPVMWFSSRDRLLEHAWATLDGIGIDKDGRTEQGWFIFPEGTDKEEIWGWFAERYSGSIGILARKGREAANGKVPWG